MREVAKIASEVPSNQYIDFFSAKELILLWRYHTIHGTLCGMMNGGGVASLPEVHRILTEVANEDFADGDDLPVFSPEQGVETDAVQTDYEQRRKTEDIRLNSTLPESEILAQLMRAKAERTVRELVNKSQWLRGSTLGIFLREQPGRFLAIKASPRFPKSLENQIEFLARSIAAVFARYEPTTGYKYLASLVERCQACDQKPAKLQLVRYIEERSRTAGSDVAGSFTHTAEQCRYSTWPCPIHHPDSPPLSGVPWCGAC
jgi:hypothetical protein